MKKRLGSYRRARIEGGGRVVVSQAGGAAGRDPRETGSDTATSTALSPWRKARAVHDPGEVLLDVALATAPGGPRSASTAHLPV
ncbi:hypothetical protein [Streptomyces sp. NBC_00859]|uniref:hypothetical protein n=1 Tax=Streptomyces sp. NBC_00859 TaxID=2903682 RepID=UPI0038655EB5